MDDYKIYREILCIDLKGFYASVECVMRGLDPFKTPLIVADEGRGGGSVVLAITPYLKTLGLKSRCRLHEIEDMRGIIVAKPRMKEYIKASNEVIKTYLEFVSEEDLHIYSIDEAFLDVTHYLTYFNMSTEALAQTILNKIVENTDLPAACGIGDNMLLSKLALDLYSKKAPNQIATLRYLDVEDKLWPIKPLSKMWGIGHRMELRLNQLGIYTVKDLATFNIKRLKRLFGVIGEELYYHANGIDMSVISEKGQGGTVKMKSVGLGQTLFEDYDATMIMQILLEMSDEVAERLRFTNKVARTIHLGIHYSKAYGGGFSRQYTLAQTTDDPDMLLDTVLTLFNKHYEDLPIRQVFIRATNLSPRPNFIQASFFEDVEKLARRKALWQSVDTIRARFGKRSAVRLSSYLEEGTLIKRSSMIGGHNG